MKPITEIQLQLSFIPHPMSSRLVYFVKRSIDLDIYLPTKGKYLQRDFVWSLAQKRELIYSMLIGRHIPHCSIINIIDPKNSNNTISQVIDGKQRLSTMISFLNNEFDISLEGDDYFFNELPNDYQMEITHHSFNYYLVNELHDSPITDQEKINWFKFINFAGTPQDTEHFRQLE